MTVLKRVLWLVLAAELLVGGLLVARRLMRPAPPRPDMRGVDSGTIADLEKVTRDALSGGSGAWRTLGEAWLGQGYYVEAEQCFRVACDIAADDQQSVYGLGFGLERVGRLEEAISVLRRAAQMSDDELSRTCRYQVGRCYLRLEQPAEAEAAFRQCADFPASAWQLSKLLIRLGRAAEAIPILDAQLSASPNLLKFVQLRALASEELGDEEAAWEYRGLEQRASPGPEIDNWMSFVTLFRSRYGIDRRLASCGQSHVASSPAQRAACLDRALDIIREEDLVQFSPVYEEAVKAHLVLQQHGVALALLDELSRTRSEDPWMAELRGDALWLQGERDEAVRSWQRCAVMWPSPTVHFKLAEHYRSGDPEAAAVHRGRFHQLRGLAAFRHNRVDEAHAAFLDAVQVSPDVARSWCYLGEARRLRGEALEARAAYTRCLELDPDYERARTSLSRLGLASP